MDLGGDETLLALSCPELTPDRLPALAALPLNLPRLPRGRGAD